MSKYRKWNNGRISQLIVSDEKPFAVVATLSLCKASPTFSLSVIKRLAAVTISSVIALLCSVYDTSSCSRLPRKK